MLQEKIKTLINLANTIDDKNNESWQALKNRAERKNKWFSQKFIQFSIDTLIKNYLNEEKLIAWIDHYDFTSLDQSKSIALILAGNIPFVGFHDVLCCYMMNLPTQIKLSSKDEILMKFIVEELVKNDPNWNCKIVNRLNSFDKVIATGSNNTNRYFEYYFKNKDSLLRNNRSSVAILNGQESQDELEALADDIFMYFGLGCRNVSKLFIPLGYDIVSLFKSFQKYEFLHHQKLYMDNYDYTRTILLMNQSPHFANEFIMLKEEEKLQSRLATLHYSFYSSTKEIQSYLQENKNDIQCVISQKSTEWKSYDFGLAQQPSLTDYADNIDTISFLLGK